MGKELVLDDGNRGKWNSIVLKQKAEATERAALGELQRTLWKRSAIGLGVCFPSVCFLKLSRGPSLSQ